MLLIVIVALFVCWRVRVRQARSIWWLHCIWIRNFSLSRRQRNVLFCKTWCVRWSCSLSIECRRWVIVYGHAILSSFRPWGSCYIFPSGLRKWWWWRIHIWRHRLSLLNRRCWLLSRSRTITFFNFNNLIRIILLLLPRSRQPNSKPHSKPSWLHCG